MTGDNRLGRIWIILFKFLEWSYSESMTMMRAIQSVDPEDENQYVADNLTKNVKKEFTDSDIPTEADPDFRYPKTKLLL